VVGQHPTFSTLPRFQRRHLPRRRDVALGDRDQDCAGWRFADAEHLRLRLRSRAAKKLGSMASQMPKSGRVAEKAVALCASG